MSTSFALIVENLTLAILRSAIYAISRFQSKVPNPSLQWDENC